MLANLYLRDEPSFFQLWPIDLSRGQTDFRNEKSFTNGGLIVDRRNSERNDPRVDCYRKNKVTEADAKCADKFKVSARAVVMSVASLPGSYSANVLATDLLLFTVTGSMASNTGRMWFGLRARIVNTVRDSLPGLLADGNCRSALCKRVL